MSAHDYRINARVRRHLVSRWVDVARLQIGCTNGVVYLIGVLGTTMEDPSRCQHGTAPLGERMLRLAVQLERELRRLPDVRDVVFKFDNAYKRGGKWRVVERKAS